MKDIISNKIREVLKDDVDFEVVFQDLSYEDKFGHYSSQVAFQVSRIEKKPEKECANEIIKNLLQRDKDSFFKKIEFVEPGFINFWISENNFYEELKKIKISGEDYGSNKLGEGKKARIEYISANPTGPLHVGNARGGPYGEALSKVFEKSGFSVLREYFHNDSGNQVEKLRDTVWYWYLFHNGENKDFPEDGYPGEYLKDLALIAHKKFGGNLKENEKDKLTEFALNYIFEENKQVFLKLGIKFDLFVSEKELIKSEKTIEVVNELKKQKVLKEKEGALWFCPKDEFLEDRESVVLKSDGKPTYFASDIAYHKQKFQSGSDIVIDIFGSNHHGHVPKLKALCKLFDFNPDNFFVLLYQFVRVKKGNEVLKMSKRAGNYISAKEVLDEVGPDNMIFSFLMNSPTTHIDFDIEKAKEESVKNPVYYSQYAYVRSVNILKLFKDAEGNDIKYSKLSTKEDMNLIRKLVQFPEIIEEIAKNFEVHKLTRYSTELSSAFHNFYENEKVIGEEKETAIARRELVLCSKTVFKNLFHLIGISAPEKM